MLFVVFFFFFYVHLDVFCTFIASFSPQAQIKLLSSQDELLAAPDVRRRGDFLHMLTRIALSSRYLYGFEEYCTSTAITFRMDLPLKQGPKGEVKSEGEAGGPAATSSTSEEQTPPVDGEPCSAQSAVCKVFD